MTITTRYLTIEVTRSHAYLRCWKVEGLLDFTGQVGSSLNRT